MRVGIGGFEFSGKSTVFRALGGVSDANRPDRMVMAMVAVPDDRLDELAASYKPKKTIHATIELTDLPGISRKAGEPRNRQILGEYRNFDALMIVVDAYGPDANPTADAQALLDEMVLADLEVLERRAVRIQKQLKGPEKDKEPFKRELALVDKLRRELEENPDGLASVSDDERKTMSSFALFALKPLILVANNNEDNPGVLIDAPGRYAGTGIPICGTLEEEVAALEPEDRPEFLSELGIGEPIAPRLCRVAYEVLALMSFFTVGRDECRAWTIPTGTHAPQAAGAIHSDLERGFIRAEVFTFDAWLGHARDEKKIKADGKLRVEGKNYVVSDGDILNIRFNV